MGERNGQTEEQIPRDELWELYVVQELSSREIGEIYGCNWQTVINRLRECNIPVRGRPEAGAIAMTKYPKYDFSGDLEEKAYLLGFRQGDLHVSMANVGGRTIRVECASGKQEQIELIKSLFERYGHVVLCGPYKGGRVSIQCLLNMSFDFLLRKQDRIDDWILASDTYFAAFLAGYVDAEGCIGIYSKKASFILATGDKLVLQQIHGKLASLGVEILEPALWIKKGYTNKQGVVCRRDIWRLVTSRKDSLLRLFDLIDPYLKHPKRRRDMELALANIEERNRKYGF